MDCWFDEKEQAKCLGYALEICTVGKNPKKCAIYPEAIKIKVKTCIEKLSS